MTGGLAFLEFGFPSFFDHALLTGPSWASEAGWPSSIVDGERAQRGNAPPGG